MHKNPLNSIHSQNIENKALYEKLEDLAKEETIDSDVIKEIINKLQLG